VECKANLPFLFLEGKNAHPLVQIYFEINHLKQLYRQGWLGRGIPRESCESVAEHVFGVAMVAYILAETYFPELDLCRVLRLALLHDIGEVYAGDITPSQSVSLEEKHRLEEEAMARIFDRLPDGKAYLDLWDEYEGSSSPEARFVRQIDRLEMALQASIYEHQGRGSLEEFFDSARQAVSDEKLIELLDAVKSSRKAD
jgi:putative hydrolase of HD superfamily